MGIYVDKRTKVVVQGITGRDGSFHARQMKEYGTNVVAGVTPGKGGSGFEGIPIFNTVAEAVEKTKANTSVIYVPAWAAVDAIYEAADAGIQVIVCITEGIPANDMLKVYNYLKAKGVRLIGPNCPGIITPGATKVGIMPGQIHRRGSVGVVSRSGTLTYEIVYNLSLRKIGQSTCIGIGGDTIIGTNFIDCLREFQTDPQTQAIVLIGEIGGTDEEEAAAFIKKHVTKPVVAFIAGLTAPADKRMGHAGAIISGGSGTAAEKIKAFEAVGIPVATSPAQVAELMEQKLESLAKATAVVGRGKLAMPKPKVKATAKKKAKAVTKKVGKKPASAKKAKAPVKKLQVSRAAKSTKEKGRLSKPARVFRNRSKGKGKKK